jgi:DNA-binding NtrC family response regulator
VKQALIVDPQGTVEDFARSALEQYEQTRTGSLQEAVALISSADYHLVLIAKPEAVCDDALWTMVERITQQAPEAAVVMVHTEDADAAFHARAGNLGVTVVTAPIGIIERAVIDQVTAG